VRPKWCQSCRLNVYPYKRFRVLPCILMLVIPYLLWYLLMKRRECPFCGSRDLRRFRKLAVKRRS